MGFGLKRKVTQRFRMLSVFLGLLNLYLNESKHIFIRTRQGQGQGQEICKNGTTILSIIFQLTFTFDKHKRQNFSEFEISGYKARYCCTGRFQLPYNI